MELRYNLDKQPVTTDYDWPEGLCRVLAPYVEGGIIEKYVEGELSLQFRFHRGAVSFDEY